MTRDGEEWEHAFYASGNEPRRRLHYIGNHRIAGAVFAPAAQDAVFLAVDGRACAPAAARVPGLAPERVRALGSARRARAGNGYGAGAGEHAGHTARVCVCCRGYDAGRAAGGTEDGAKRPFFHTTKRLRRHTAERARRARNGVHRRVVGRKRAAAPVLGAYLRARPAPLPNLQTHRPSVHPRMAAKARPAPSAGGAAVRGH